VGGSVVPVRLPDTGLRRADGLPSALVLAAICLAAFPLFSYVVVAMAKLHAVIARALLRLPQDPLEEAREVLRRPGPLTPVPGDRAGIPGPKSIPNHSR
jgi:hypothetical protein